MKENIIKTVPISSDQAVEIQSALHVTDVLIETIHLLIEKEAAKRVRRERDTWDEVAQLAGFKDMQDVHSQGLKMTTDYNRLVIQIVDIGKEEGQCE